MHERIQKKTQATAESDSEAKIRRRQETEALSNVRIHDIHPRGATGCGGTCRGTRSATHESQRAHSVLQLQRDYGNRFVQRMIARHLLQTKLSVSTPGDAHEQEADRVAEHVMRMPEPEATEQLAISRKPESIRIQRMCGACEEEMSRQPMEEEDQMLQGVERTDTSGEVGLNLETDINAMRGTGTPLPASERAFFEPRFGADLSQVRVHTDSRAAQLSQAVSAKAFTVGQDVAFGPGQYSPNTSAGRKLLAHELTHTLQQREGEVSHKLLRDAGAPPPAPSRKGKVKSGPKYTPNGTITPTNSGGMKTATFTREAEFEHDPANNIHASCCEIRQYIKWSAGEVPPRHAGFEPASSYHAGTWYVDRDAHGNICGPRSGTGGMNKDGCHYEDGSGTWDRANGAVFKGHDSPSGLASRTGEWYFELRVIDTCNGNAEIGGKDSLTVDF
jgi:hypothetical protein